MKAPKQIMIEMEVDKVTPIRDSLVRVDGYVGDYRVIVFMAENDPKLKGVTR